MNRMISLECGGPAPLWSSVGYKASCCVRKRCQAAAGQSDAWPSHSKERPLLKDRILRFVSSLAVVVFLVSTLAAQSPEILKVDPPSWWVQSSMNPVRLLIRGRNLTGARLQPLGRGLRVVGQPKINQAGTYIFADISIAPNAPAGERRIRVTTPRGNAEARFEVLPPPDRARRFQGFSPDDVMYLLMIDRFSDGDQTNNNPPESRGIYDRGNKFYYHGGDLQGVIDRLPYLKDLGVTAIWLTPWYDNYNGLNHIELKEDKPSTAFHGYNPQDFYRVEEHFGTLAKLQQLVDAAHRAGIKIIQDQVVNHTGPYHPWVDDSPTPTWFNGTRKNHLKNVFQTWVLHDPQPVEQLKRETMEGWFLDFLPDLNQHDPEVSRYLIQNTLWWIGTTGLDGIRMDTWQYVPNAFWRDWNRALKREFPRFTVVGEVKDGDVVHTSFFQGGTVRFDGVDSGLDSLLDFPLFYPIRHAFAEGKALDDVPKTLAKDYLYTNPEILVTLLGGHDDGRFMSEKGATLEGLKLANTLVLTTRGVPQLYYGDEIAMTGPDEPTTRKDFPGGFPGDKRNAFTREGRSLEENDVFDHIRKLNRVRAELEPLRRGSLINLYTTGQQYAYARKTKNQVAIVVINNDKKDATIDLDVTGLGIANGTLLNDLLGPMRSLQVRDGKVRIALPQRSAGILAAPDLRSTPPR
ncbi:MAG TPA: alpha-amylase family glycosyl hydrolase [Pyrinomonadaceae bacterium]|nr:alpha-amylase family glycosyl hydrolase [Pyrinomonadaceae bacterium]